MGEEPVDKIEKYLQEIVDKDGNNEQSWIPVMDGLGFTVGAISYFLAEVANGKSPPARLLAKAIFHRHQKRQKDTKSKPSWAKFVARMAFLLEKPKSGKDLLQILTSGVADEDAIKSVKEFCTKIYFQEMKVRDLPHWVSASLMSKLDESVLLKFLQSRNFSLPSDKSHHSVVAACRDAIRKGSDSESADKMVSDLLNELETAGAPSVYRQLLEARWFELSTDEEDLATAISYCNVRFLPQKLDKELVGRKGDLDVAIRLLNDDGCVDIYGKRGVGKTSLALSAVYEVKAKYQFLVWLDATSTEHFQVSLSKLSAVALNLKRMSSKSLLPEVLRRAKEWLTDTAKKGPVLVVIDGLNDREILKGLSDFLPKVTEGIMHVLLTSTDKVGSESIPSLERISTYRLEKLLDKDVKRALMNVCRSQLAEEQTDAATKIAKSLDGDPLLMTIVTTFMIKNGFTITQYWDYLQNASQPLKSRDGPSPCPEASERGAQYDAILSTIFGGFPLTTKYVNLIAFCDTAAIPVDIFKYENPPGDDERRNDRRRKRRRTESDDRICRVTLTKLAGFGLIKWKGEDSFSVHTELAKNFRERLTRDQQIKSLKALSEILKTAFYCCQSDWDFCGSMYPHALRCEEYMNTLQLFDAELLVQCGHMKSLLGDGREARNLLQRCLDSADVAKKDKADAYINLATVERRLGNSRVAIDNVRTAKSVLEESEEEEEEEEEEDLYNDQINRAKEVEAEILMDAGNYGRALEILNEIEMKPDLCDIDPAGCSALWANRARAHLGLRKFSEARDLYEKAKNLLKEGDHRFTLYQIYQHIATALEIKRTQDAGTALAPFRKEQSICSRMVADQLPSFHRYCAWGHRSVARLKLREVNMIKDSNRSFNSDLSSGDAGENSDQILNVLRDAFSQIRACIDCHVEIGNTLHLSVAKACDLVGRLCIEWIERPKAYAKKTACLCAKAHFQLAVKILRPQKDERLPGIEKLMKEVNYNLKSKKIDPDNYENDHGETSFLDVLKELVEKIDKLRSSP